MRHTIKTTHYTLTNETTEYLDHKLRSLDKLLPEEALVEIELGRETETQQHGAVWRAELTTFVDGRIVRAVKLDETMHAAIDAMKDDVMSQLKKTITRKKSIMRRGGARIKEWLKFGQE